MASSNLFGPPTDDDIKVGYIDSERGYVSGLTKCEANEYAKKDPGTTFIFKSGNNILRYLNINEVNKLTANDLLNTDECGGLNQKKECGQPELNIFGGGGIGAVGNPVIGSDGSILAVDLVSGGHGYQFPPQVRAIDECQYGNGAVFTAVLGEVTESYETYEGEEDFEEYELCESIPEDYGRNYGPGGEDLGPWDPSKYTKVGKDPIQKEIETYTKLIRELERKPFWTTRKYKPDRIRTSDSKIKQAIKHDVTHPAWNEFMNSYAISPVPPSNVPGTDFAGILFTMEWDNEFPITGDYVFRGLCDNRAVLYFDNLKIADLGGFGDPVNSITKTIKEGKHKIRIDLYNEPIYQKIQTAVTSKDTNFVDVSFNVYGEGKNTNKMIFSFMSEDGSHSFSIKGNEKTKQNRTETIKVKPNLSYKVIASSTRGQVEQGLIKNGKKNKEGGIGDSQKVFADHISSDNDNDDIQISTSLGTFVSSNKRPVNKDGTGRNTYDLKFKVESTTSSSGSKPSATGFAVKKVFNTIDYISKANRTLWRTNTYGRGGFLGEAGICPFDTSIEQLKDNPYAGTHQIVWKNVSFPVSGNYKIRLEVDDNVTLSIGNQLTIRKEGFVKGTSTGTGELNQTSFIKAGTYDIVADLEQIPGGKFGFGGVKGTNPMALAVDIEVAVVEQNVVSAKSWNENPMGVSLSIDSPEPPIPQEPAPIQEGRCPPNPIWSTRSPGSREKWYPVKFFGSKSPQGRKEPWAPFFNRYAISPIPPLTSIGTDAGGTIFKNSWEIDIPYDGFYKFQVQRDDTARIYLDGNLAFDIKTAGDDLWKNFRNKVKSQKVFITKGRHTISIELENSKSESFQLIDQKIFDTKDWASIPKTSTINAATTKEEWVKVSDVYVPPNSQTGDRGRVITTIPSNASFHKHTEGTYYKGKKIRDGGDWNNTDPYTNYIEWDKDTRLTLGSYKGDRFGIAVWNKKVTAENKATTTTTYTTNNQSPTSPGVTYSGPALASYRNGKLGPFLTPAFKDDDDYRANNMDKKWILTWTNVDFPEDGRYDLQAEADDYVIVRVDGNEVGKAKVFDGVKTFTFNATKGKRTIELEIYNIPGNENSTFETNPIVFNAVITKKINASTGRGKSWDENPTGIGAALVPPPCPRLIRGKGVVTDIKIIDPGNGYLPPAGTGYPVTLRLKEVIVEDPGINYNCGVDKLRIVPDNGAQLDYVCDPFGKIKSITILNPGLGFTEYPDISLPSDTGVNARFRPQFEVVRDPIAAPRKLIQVTDLVGLKQTGYVDGRAYYGAVFFKDGVSYAGFYETPGQLVQVYATLQESIDAQVTTRASAIQRQGTDITSNDPRLDIPNTPDNLI